MTIFLVFFALFAVTAVLSVNQPAGRKILPRLGYFDKGYRSHAGATLSIGRFRPRAR
jgi:hypothetical protein